ncbi:uncharacterized protein LOC103841013 [Brassica rapa]|uniref:DUF4408 domain-containing protein n=1 Tax=Brassica campestris TaxID=3711 RepID=A0A3P5YNA9_BRACM|nr:uncharacterized protein LOC103841013 [Brassica rapa]CAG7865150.1 unnamed protein product [Brassica rapa]VDC62251.1 unnamed protein product [Brassica rapa]
MDSISFANVKAEKAKALHRFQRIGFLFRAAEICLALLLLCWIFSSLPFAARISGEFLRRLACVVSSPLFIFVLGNSIVVALLTTKSTVFSSGGDGGGEADIYDVFIRSGENRASSSDVRDIPEEPTVYYDKQMIGTETESVSNSIPTVAREDHVTTEPEKETVTVTDVVKDYSPPPTKVYRRSKSEKQRQDTVTKPSLRRSETEKCRETVKQCEEVPFPEDNLTNEEFQKTIEAFIAKQLIFRRRESLAVVIP